MITSFIIEKGKVTSQTGLPVKGSIWVDVFRPTENEKHEVERAFGIELFTRQETEEIESSSKFSEDEREVGINLNFISLTEDGYNNEPVSFILTNGALITQRNYDFRTIRETQRKLSILKPKNDAALLLLLLEARIDYDADLIENITDQISRISRRLIRDEKLDRDILIKINSLQDTTIAIRENIVEKQRVTSSILKSKFFPTEDYETIRIMIKDVGSLLDHTSFNFERLEFLQNTFLGLGNIEQNRVIKIFTVMTVVFMPPTLIASMYGMNFPWMPGLDNNWGYAFSVFLMIASSAITLLVFRRKNWL